MRARLLHLVLAAIAALAWLCCEAEEGGSASSTAGGGGASSTSSEPGGHGGAGAAAGSGQGGTAGSGGGTPVALTVVSLNLHCLRLDGTSFASNEERFAAVAAEVAAEGVGVLALQEVCAQSETVALELLESALESATGHDWSSAWELAHVAWEGTADEADEGVGLLVRGAIGASRALVHTTQGPLRRVALAAQLPGELGGHFVVSAHLENGDAEARLAQARELASFGLSLGEQPGHVIVAGDFNDQKTGPAYGALGAFGYVDQTASLATSLIDHLFAHRGAPLAVVEAKLLFDGSDGPEVSDHPAVLVRLSTATGSDFPLTTIRLHASPAPGTFLAVRGSQPPLDWGWGWPAHERSAGLWELRLSELAAGTFEYKSLRDDVAWQLGSNEVGTAGALNESTPSY